MSNQDVELITKVIAEVKRGKRPFSRDLLKYCYFEDLQARGASEPSAASEKWIDYYLEHLSAIPYERLEKACSSPQKLAKLLIEALGK